MLRARLVARFPGAVAVVLERLLGRSDLRRQHDVGVATLGRPFDSVATHHAGNPDRWMRVRVRPRPGIDVAVLVVLAFPAEGTRRRPGLDDEVVRFLVALPVERRGGVVGDALASGAAHPAADQSASRNHVDLSQLFGQPERVVPDRQDVAQQDDLGAIGDSREDRRLDVHHTAHAERRRVVLVEHQAVESHLLGVDFLVQVAVVEFGPDSWVVCAVAQIEVLDVASGRSEVAGVWILIGPLGEVADEHSAPPRPSDHAQ